MENLCDSIYSKDFFFFLKSYLFKTFEPKIRIQCVVKTSAFHCHSFITTMICSTFDKGQPKYCSGVFCNNFNKSKLEPPTLPFKK